MKKKSLKFTAVLGTSIIFSIAASFNAEVANAANISFLALGAVGGVLALKNKLTSYQTAKVNTK